MSYLIFGLMIWMLMRFFNRFFSSNSSISKKVPQRLKPSTIASKTTTKNTHNLQPMTHAIKSNKIAQIDRSKKMRDDKPSRIRHLIFEQKKLSTMIIYQEVLNPPRALNPFKSVNRNE